jgi:peptidoglycan/xylan/chitin deacetylase (PgdA/CDA1 family)
MDQPNTYNGGWREYGNRGGGFRIAETLQQSGIRPTLLVNTEVYEHAPQLTAAFRALDAEVVAHGRTNAVQPNDQDEDTERRSIEDVTATIERHEGTPPRGWMSPGANPSRAQASRKIRGAGLAMPHSRADRRCAKWWCRPIRSRSALPLVMLTRGPRAARAASAGSASA